ncbi:MAG: hypothetical protein H6702_06015 [Myxococcales bacterium]|nr:hypothetical protein [Myxococcales bacterium]
MARLIVIGAGELGGRVARAWAAAGGEAHGYTASEARHDALRSAGVTPHLGLPDALAPTDHLLLAVPGSARQREVLQALQSKGLAAPGRVVLIGSTAIHGGHPRGTVDEATPPGTGARAQAAADAEAAFRAWAGDAGVVLRCGGLYRPGRGPLSALQRKGVAPEGPPDKTLGLIHYDDAAAAAHAALTHPAPRPVYLAVTPPCPSRLAFYTAACVLLDLPAPRFTAPLGGQPAVHDVRALRADLLPTAAHPKWQEALVPA